MAEISLKRYVGDKTPRILIVDDEPINLKVLAAHLVRWGCSVHAAPGGREAIEAVETFAPDLILLDIMMPEMSGYDVCKVLQHDPAAKAIPIIFLTAVAGEQAMVQGLALGAKDYITKPFVSADLAARVGAQLQQRYLETEHAVEGREAVG
jgi:two-component system, sensor histidine kinase and response regulator